MSRWFLVLALLSSAAFAKDIEVALGDRAPLKSRKAIHEVVVRDPSLVNVVVTDGAVSLEGIKHGVTGITVHYEDGEVERMLVMVGNATNSKGPRLERAQAIDLKQTEAAQAKAAAPAKQPKPKERTGAAVQEASDVVRAAVEAL